MTDAAFLATYSDLKLVKTRSVAQVILEVPIERAREVTDALGFPLPGEEVHVGVARVDLTKAQPQGQIAHANDEHKPRPLSQVAAILCNNVAFRRFLVEEKDAPSPLMADEAADWVREYCGVQSRRELDKDDTAAGKFTTLRNHYDAWMRAA